jgi:hypothetical protein
VKKRRARAGDHVHCSLAERPEHLNPPREGCLVADDIGDVGAATRAR